MGLVPRSGAAKPPTQRILIVSLLALWLNAVVAILLFHFVEGLSLIDACYFTVTIISTVGFGDFSFHDSQPWMKMYATVLMLTGPATLAILIGLLTDLVISHRLAAILGRRTPVMRNHIVVCGLGQLGFRIVQHLRKQGMGVFVIEKNADDEFIERARDLGSEVMVGDARLPTSLEKAQLMEADSLIIATDDDLTNLEVAVNARAVRPELRVVLRMFDANLAQKMETAFDIHTVFSSTALAAPAFAMAALDPRKSIVNSAWVGDELLVTAQLEIKEGCELAGMTINTLEADRNLKVLSHRSREGQAAVLPSETTEVKVGDEVTLVVQASRLESLHLMNEAGYVAVGPAS